MIGAFNEIILSKLYDVIFGATTTLPYYVVIPVFGHLLQFHSAGAAQGIESVVNKARVELFFPQLQMIQAVYLYRLAQGTSLHLIIVRTLQDMGLPADRIAAVVLHSKVFHPCLQ